MEVLSPQINQQGSKSRFGLYSEKLMSNTFWWRRRGVIVTVTARFEIAHFSWLTNIRHINVLNTLFCTLSGRNKRFICLKIFTYHGKRIGSGGPESDGRSCFIISYSICTRLIGYLIADVRCLGNMLGQWHVDEMRFLMCYITNLVESPGLKVFWKSAHTHWPPLSAISY